MSEAKWTDLQVVLGKMKELVEETGGFPSSKKLHKMGYSGLLSAIHKYHNGINHIRKLLGFELPSKRFQWEKRELSTKQEQYILDHYLEMEYALIARNIGIPRYTVVYFLKRNGLEGTKKVLPLTDEQQKELVENYPSKTGQEWADYFGVSLTTLRHVVRSLKLNGTIKDPGKRFVFTEKHDVYILEHYLTSSQEEIAKHIGCNKQQINRRIQFLGLKGYKRWNEENENHLKDNWLLKSDDELAKETGRTVSAIIAERIQLGLFRETDLDKSGVVRISGTGSSRRPVQAERRKQRWTDDEIHFLMDHAEEMSDDEIATVLERSYRSVKHKRLQLKIHREGSRSSFEIEIENFLIENNIPHQVQFRIGRYKYDFLIENTLYEFHGDYYHCNPNFYPNGPINTLQAYVVAKDKNKNETAIDRQYQIDYIWENDFVFKKEKVFEKLLAAHGRNAIDVKLEKLGDGENSSSSGN